MKLQVEDGIVEVIRQRDGIRVTLGSPPGSLLLTPDEVRVLLTLLEVASGEPV